MYCVKCGKEIESGKTICEDCSSTVPEACDASIPAQDVVINEEVKGMKKRKMLIIVLIVLMVLAVGITAIALFWTDQENKRIEDERIHSLHPVLLEVAGIEPSSGNAMIPVSVSGEDIDGSTIERIYYLSQGGTGVILMQGTYELSFPACVIADDGVVYLPPEIPLEISIPDSLEYEEPFEVTGSEQEIAFTKIDPLEVTDEQIQQAYDYLVVDPANSEEATTLRDLALQVRADAIEAKRIADEEAAAAALAQKEANGRYYSCPYYVIDLPNEVAPGYKIRLVESEMFYFPDGLGIGWTVYISPSENYIGSNYVEISVLTPQWRPQGDFNDIKIGESSDGNVIWMYQATDATVPLLQEFKNYVSVK